MARARNIKPAFFQNEDLADLCPLTRLFFIGLWTEADYKGCVELRPKRLKVRILPYDDCNTESLAINLERSGFIRIYSVGGQKYLKITNFEKHQNPHKNERESGSEIPDINESDPESLEQQGIENNREENGTTREENGTAPADSLLLIPPSPFPDPPTPSPPIPASPAGFAEFWDAYPKKIGKGAAEKAFRKSKIGIRLLPAVLSAIEQQSRSDQWIRDGGQYIPNPATWLNQRRWEDAPASSDAPRYAGPYIPGLIAV